MELEDIQALVWVAEHGSLHATAKAEGVSRSTLRRRLDRLEASVGAPVMVTSDRGLRLTPAGELVMQHATELLARRDAILERVRGVLVAPEGTLKVIGCNGFPPAMTGHLLALAARSYPGVAFDVRRAARPFEHLDPTVDLVVTWADHEPPPGGYSRVFHRVATGLVAAGTYLDAHGAPTSLDDLQGHVLLHEKGTPLAWPLRDGGQHPVHASHRLDDAYVLGCAAAAGVGIALIPRDGAGLHSSFDALRPVLDGVVQGTRGVRFYTPVATHHRGPASAVVDQLNRFADLLEAQGVGAR